MKAKSAAVTSPAEIRRLALWLTLVSWGFMAVASSAVNGQPPGRAICIATLAALAGWLAWVSYRLISRRNDGLVMIFIVMNAMCMPRRSSDRSLTEDITRWTVVVLLPLMLVSCLTAWAVRLPRKPTSEPAGSTVWDAERDPPRVS